MYATAMRRPDRAFLLLWASGCVAAALCAVVAAGVLAGSLRPTGDAPWLARVVNLYVGWLPWVVVAAVVLVPVWIVVARSMGVAVLLLAAALLGIVPACAFALIAILVPDLGPHLPLAVPIAVYGAATSLLGAAVWAMLPWTRADLRR